MKVFAKTLVALSAVALSPMALAYNSLDHGSAAIVSDSVKSRDAVRAQAIAALQNRPVVSGDNQPYQPQTTAAGMPQRGEGVAGAAQLWGSAWLPHEQRDVKSS